MKCENKELVHRQMKNIGYLVFLICFMFIASQKSNAQKLENPISEAYLKNHLSNKSPRLILTPEVERNLKLKLKSDPLVQKYYQFLQEEADRITEIPILKNELEGFRFPDAREGLRRLGILGIVYRIDKNPKILKRINDELIAICAFKDWNPQHFLDVSQLAVAVSLAIDWTGYALPKETVKLAKAALIEKALLPSFNEKGERMGWINGSNNWNAVCHGGLVAAALAIADEDPALAAKTISRALEKLPNSLKEYAPKGVHPEGPFYWRFGTSFTVVASDVLKTALGSDFGISQSPGFMKTAEYRLQVTAPSGECFNYADSEGKTDGEASAVLAWFAAQTGNGTYIHKRFFENPADPGLLISGEALIPQNEGRLAGVALIWLSQCSFEKSSELPLAWYGKGHVPVAVFRSKNEDPGQFYLAAKGGSGLISHGNMDAGSFVFELNGVRWSIDPGNQVYYNLNKIGFDLGNSKQESERWTLLTKNNFGHSTISVNDVLFRVKGNAPVTDFKDGVKAEASIDMTELYGGNVNSMKRRFIKESNQSLLIEDQFETNDSTGSITWQLMTTADVVPNKHGAILKQDGKELKLSILTPENLQVSILSLDPAPLEIDKQIKKLKRIEIRVPAYILKDKKGMIKVRLSGE